jgi:hypothetical protein
MDVATAAATVGVPGELLAAGNLTAMSQLLRQMALGRTLIHINTQIYVPIHILTQAGASVFMTFRNHSRCGHHGVTRVPGVLGTEITGGRAIYFSVNPNLFDWHDLRALCHPTSNRAWGASWQTLTGGWNVTTFHASRVLMNAVTNPEHIHPRQGTPTAAAYATGAPAAGWIDDQRRQSCEAADCCEGQWGLVDTAFRAQPIITYVVSRALSPALGGCVVGMQ